jgi:hypothetical protein
MKASLMGNICANAAVVSVSYQAPRKQGCCGPKCCAIGAFSCCCCFSTICAALCGCCLLLFAIMVAFGVYSAQCFNGNASNTATFYANTTNLSQLSLQNGFGSVEFTTIDDQSANGNSIEITVYSTAMQSKWLGGISVDFTKPEDNNGIAVLKATQPQWNWLKCQLSHVSILIPASLSFEIPSTAINMESGDVFFSTNEDHPLGNVSISLSDGGAIYSDGAVFDGLNVDLKRGSVGLQNTATSSAYLRVADGSINANNVSVSTGSFDASVEQGSAAIANMTGGSAKVHVGNGNIYARLLATPSYGWSGSFYLKTDSGNTEVHGNALSGVSSSRSGSGSESSGTIGEKNDNSNAKNDFVATAGRGSISLEACNSKDTC